MSEVEEEPHIGYLFSCDYRQLDGESELRDDDHVRENAFLEVFPVETEQVEVGRQRDHQQDVKSDSSGEGKETPGRIEEEEPEEHRQENEQEVLPLGVSEDVVVDEVAWLGESLLLKLAQNSDVLIPDEKKNSLCSQP